ncbi:hypothetical protein DBR11_14725 [Pedobacter sp. HMWF019]|uniref:right-handed parallel beta-helix repeat-containing protein n=1 Tax=Pedobacter sp. HMWF019 TaxID=2056856 RepID=UPI000D3A7CD4|nr:right-handed parallel beta-helix repeat-containing protein [Pedobacter sp. HMWF019]PTS98498.1 hypothetical protein DBR11_14725 [Pedobacter sp. HMWF019]
MALIFDDNIQANVAKPTDNKSGIFENGVWRPYNNLQEFYDLQPISGRYEGQFFLVRKGVKMLDLYWLEGQVNVATIFKTDIDLSDYFTKEEIEDLLDLKANKNILTTSDITLAQAINDFIYGITDANTGESVNLIKITDGSIPIVDKVIFFQRGTDYYKRIYSKINVRWFGAKGDGVHDDYYAVQAACSALNNIGRGTMLFPTGIYYIDHYKVSGPNPNGITNLTISGITELIIEGGGSLIKMKGGWTRTADYSAGSFTYSYSNCVGIVISECNNVTISDLEIDGGAETITKVATAEGVSHGIMLDACKNLNLKNIHVHHFCADGLIIRSKGLEICRNISAMNCRFTNNARQAMSIIQLRQGVFINCEFRDTGNTGLYGGHSPQGGVDIEPDTKIPAVSENTGDIVFIGSLFQDNKGFEFVTSNELSVSYPINIIGCTFKNTNRFNPQVLPAAALVRFTNCLFEDVGIFPAYSLSTRASKTEIINCTINSHYQAEQILFASGSIPFVKVDGCEINLLGTAAHTTQIYRIYSTNSNLEFINNKISISALEHSGTGNLPIITIQNARRSISNRWSTDLISSGVQFQVISTNVFEYKDFFVNPIFLSARSIPLTTNWYSLGSSPVDYIESVSSIAPGAKILWGASSPATGN